MKTRDRHVLIFFLIATVAGISSFFLDSFIAEKIPGVHNSFLDIGFNVITNFMLLVAVLYLLPSMLIIITTRKRAKISSLVQLWISGLCGGIISMVLKTIIQRERPIIEMTFAGMQDYSFPSTHAAIAAAALPILWYTLPKLRAFWIVWVVLVLFSRIYLELHYLSDVVWGSVLGLGIGWCVIKLVKIK